MSASNRRALALFGVFAFALGVRALGFEQVFTSEGVAFAPADATYHMRRAFYTFANFPEPLLHDPLLNFPGGVNVPWPPLFDWLVGGVAHLFARDQAGFEHVGAWASSVFGALTVVPIYFIARRVATPGIGLFAGLLFSLFPMCVKYGRVGNPDHHTAVALVGACLLLLLTQLARPDRSDRSVLGLAPWMVAARLAMFLTWHGNLLYIGFFEASVLSLSVAMRREAIIRAELLSCIFSALLLGPIVEQLLPVPIGGAYSSISLSRLHVLVMVGAAFVAACHLGLQRWRPDSGTVPRLLAMGGAGVAFVAFLLLFPPTRNGLVPAFRFLSMRDGAGLATLEQLPLFSIFGRDPVQSPEKPWAYFAYLLPLVPFAFPVFVREREKTPAAWVMTGWTAGFVFLAMAQRRYGNDLAPGASVAFALWLLGLPRAAVAKWGNDSPIERRAAAAFGALTALALFSPVLLHYEIPRLASGVSVLFGGAPQPAAGIDLIAQNVADFGRKVRAATPETGGFLDQRRIPEYGIIAHANLGHVLHYHGRRATATDPMWSYIGPENWARSLAFFRAREERTAIALAAMLHGRYVVTSRSDDEHTVAGRLHRRDGRRSDEGPRLEHFRLVAESSPGRVGFELLFDQKVDLGDPSQQISYKLFEIVRGAVLEIEAAPGTHVSASITVESPSGRRFTYTASDVAGEEGQVRLRVPYSTAGQTPIAATGPYRVSAGLALARIDVDESDVLEGRTVAVPFDGGRAVGF